MLDKYSVDDLKRFVEHSESLTSYNSYLAYLCIIFNTVGSFVSMYSTGTDNSELLWVGIGFSAISQLLGMFEKVNNEEIKQMQKSIKAIKEGTYIDASTGDPEKKKRKKKKKKTIEEDVKDDMLYVGH